MYYLDCHLETSRVVQLQTYCTYNVRRSCFTSCFVTKHGAYERCKPATTRPYHLMEQFVCTHASSHGRCQALQGAPCMCPCEGPIPCASSHMMSQNHTIQVQSLYTAPAAPIT